MWAAVEPGLQPEVVLPDLQPLAGVDYCLKAQESGKPEKGKKSVKCCSSFHAGVKMGQMTEKGSSSVFNNINNIKKLLVFYLKVV